MNEKDFIIKVNKKSSKTPIILLKMAIKKETDLLQNWQKSKRNILVKLLIYYI
jgi:hypothetical protein